MQTPCLLKLKSKPKPKLWVGLGPDKALRKLLPLWEEHRRHREAFLVPYTSLGLGQLRGWLGQFETDILVVGESFPDFCSESPFFEGENGALHVVGHLNASLQSIADYAIRAAKLLQRPVLDQQSVALLGGIERRYLALLESLELCAQETDLVHAFNWSAERIRRQPLIKALRAGLAAALFSGHGSPQGWLAYGGVGDQSLGIDTPWSDAETIAIAFSLSCKTGTGKFANALVTKGIAGAVLAPREDILHTDNRLLAHAIVNSLAAGTPTLGEAVRVAARSGASLKSYVIFGDPALRPAATRDALTRSQNIFAPAPDFDLSLMSANG